MKMPLLRIVCLCLLLDSARADDVYLKDGKVVHASSLRRDGNFLFAKTSTADGSGNETLIPIAQIDRISCIEPPALLEARQHASLGNADTVLQKTQLLLDQNKPLADIAGSAWPEIVRLRMTAIVASQKTEAFFELQKNWIPTGDPDLENAAKWLGAAASGINLRTLRDGLKAASVPGASSLSAGIAWLEFGKEALEAKQWQNAIRAFLSVEVFLKRYPLLHPTALLGAIRAFAATNAQKEGWTLVEELRSRYPESPQVKIASDLMSKAALGSAPPEK